MVRPKKIRIDLVLVQKGLVESCEMAVALIMAGKVLVEEQVVDKVGTIIDPNANIRIRTNQKYVSRGGLKLEKAIQEFTIDVAGKTCLDVGASTGGFSDCLLQQGAKKIFAVDVGYGQLHWNLRQDERVVILDRTNFRNMDLNKITDPIELAVMDVSFISVKRLVPRLVDLFTMQSTPGPKTFICLIKPQFEVSSNSIAPGGIVRDDVVRESALNDIIKFIAVSGFQDLKYITSPITGKDGNIEFLSCARF